MLLLVSAASCHHQPSAFILPAAATKRSATVAKSRLLLCRLRVLSLADLVRIFFRDGALLASLTCAYPPIDALMEDDRSPPYRRSPWMVKVLFLFPTMTKKPFN
jgi:hypothetical protein